MNGAEYERLADIEVEAVEPERHGFTLVGEGPDHAGYRVELRFEMPLDPRTRSVVGELLSQSGLVISRRAPARLAGGLKTRRERAHHR